MEEGQPDKGIGEGLKEISHRESLCLMISPDSESSVTGMPVPTLEDTKTADASLDATSCR